jgi:hypothetical protein
VKIIIPFFVFGFIFCFFIFALKPWGWGLFDRTKDPLLRGKRKNKQQKINPMN